MQCQQAYLKKRSQPLTCDLHSKFWPIVRARCDVFDFANCQHAIDDFPENRVLPVQKVGGGGCYEELDGGQNSHRVRNLW
jgi:hypothetical protein